MKHNLKNACIVSLVAVVVLYIGYCTTWLYLRIRILYPGQLFRKQLQTINALQSSTKYRVRHLSQFSIGTLLIIPSRPPPASGLPCVIHMHGNAETALDCLQTWQANAFSIFNTLVSSCVVVLIEYPQWQVEPKYRNITETTILEPIQQILNAIAGDYLPLHINVDRVVLYGRSLGGGVACRTAARNSWVRGLVLESTFLDVGSMLTRVGLLRYLAYDHKYDNKSAIQLFDSPGSLCILHGCLDMVTPITHARLLYQCSPIKVPWKQLHEAPQSGHNDMPTDWVLRHVLCVVDCLPH